MVVVGMKIISNEKNSGPDVLMITESKRKSKDVAEVCCCHFQIVSFSTYLKLVLGACGVLARLCTFQKIYWFKLHS